MKIYFSFSISRSTPDIRDNCVKIAESIKSLGHKIFPENIFEKDSKYYENQTESQARQAQKDLTKYKKASDIVILEVSCQSLGVGQELAFALSIKKPVIALYKEGNKPHILKDEAGDFLILVPYREDNIDEVVKDAIEYASGQQDVRFNFFISPSIGHYLDWVSKIKKVPRSVYLRSLIEKEIEKNEDYGA